MELNDVGTVTFPRLYFGLSSVGEPDDSDVAVGILSAFCAVEFEGANVCTLSISFWGYCIADELDDDSVGTGRISSVCVVVFDHTGAGAPLKLNF